MQPDRPLFKQLGRQRNGKRQRLFGQVLHDAHRSGLKDHHFTEDTGLSAPLLGRYGCGLRIDISSNALPTLTTGLG